MKNISVSRRGFIQGSGVLTIGFVVAPKGMMKQALAQDSSAKTSLQANAFVSIHKDNSVEIIINHSEMGQGIYTALSQVIADELDADWSLVSAKHLGSLNEEYANPAFQIIGTGGSTSTSSEWQRFREAGATARSMIVNAAAKHWGVNVDTLKTQNSQVINENGEHISYGELVAMAAEMEVPTSVKLKTVDDFVYIGKDVRRIEGPSKVNGNARFGIDVDLPDMLAASVKHSPVFGGKIKSIDSSEAEKMPGVVKVVQYQDNAVAVIADSFWQAKKAKDALNLEWENGEFASQSTDTLWQEFDKLAQTDGAVFESRGDIENTQAVKQYSAEYRFPYLAHATMEPLNATAQFKDSKLQMWAGTQFQTVDASNISALTGIEVADISINEQWLGGGFGRRAVATPDYMVEAALIAQKSELTNPIKMLWQREDDVQGGYYRPMFMHQYTVGVNEEGYPITWQHQVVGNSIAAGTLFEPVMIHEGVDHLSVEGIAKNKYQIENVKFSAHNVKNAVPVLWWRSVGNTHTAPVVEGMLNKLSKEAGIDPFEFRRQLLKDNQQAARTIGVLNELENKSDWKMASADNVFKGMAVHESFGSVCGYVVELKKESDTLSFHKVIAVMDCGIAVNPENVKAQTFGAAIYGLASILGQKIDIKDGSAVQSNFHDYPIVKMAQVPDIDVHLVNSTNLDVPTGVGEPGLPPFIPAFLAAVYAATGQEITSFPMQLDGFSMA